jgi:HD-like signal output (HDOD) protein
MPVDPQLRSLDIAIPAQPEALVKLSLLLAEEDVQLGDLATLIESDMALASAVLKAVNSSLYGLKGRVQTVQQAITYLGMREIASVTYEMGLRAVFRHAKELEPVWQRAGLRGLVMGRLGQLLDIDPWAAHSAGLFEECGKAVLYRHAPDHYRSMLRAATNDTELITLERAGFGVSHDALGAAMCESWDLAAEAVVSVRHHVQIHATGELPDGVQRPTICALSALAHALMVAPATLDDVANRVALRADLDATLVLRGAHKVQDQLAEAAATRPLQHAA